MGFSEAVARCGGSLSRTLLEHALAWAAAGFAVFPVHTVDQEGRCSCGNSDCQSRGKHPRTKRGCHDCSRDPGQIRSWWARNWADSNVGVATGSASGDGSAQILVVDVDPRHGGWESLEELQRRIGQPLPATLQVVTGSQGAHVYFRAPAELVLANRAGILPGIDVRGSGGYVVAPPSRHASGGVYVFEASSHELGARTPVAPAPAELLEFVREHRPAVPLDLTDRIPDGRRGNALFEVACGYVRQGLSEAAVMDELRRFADKHCEGMIPDKRICAIAGSALKQVAKKRASRAAAAITAKAPADSLAGPAPDTRAILLGEKHTDTGNAVRFLAAFPNSFRWLPAKSGGDWLQWDGTRWVADETGGVVRAMTQVARDTLAAATAAHDDRLWKHALRLQNMKDLRAALEALKFQRTPTGAAAGWPLNRQTIIVKRSWFDRDPFVLNCPNGVLDLKTGELREHRPSDLLRRRVAVAYDPTAQCPTWRAFLRSIFLTGPGGLPDDELIAYMQRALGYSICGDVSEQVMFVFYGSGANGKSTLIESVAQTLGDYSHAMSFKSFLDDPRRPRGGDEPRSDLVQLAGPRFVHAVESDVDGRLDEAVVKAITGGDTMRVRDLYERPFAFKPQFTLILGTNHRPAVRGTNHAIWRRLKLVPFDATFATSAEEERAGLPAADRALPRKLAAEAAGILNWLVEGCLAWQANGLGSCRRVDTATAAYRTDSNPLHDWMTEACTRNTTAVVPALALYRSYLAWANGKQVAPMSNTAFGTLLTEQGFPVKRGAGGNRRVGLALRGTEPPEGTNG